MTDRTEPTIPLAILGRAIAERVQFLDELVSTIAEGGTTLEIVRSIVLWLDGWDMLGEWDREQLATAWEAAGGHPGSLPVADLGAGSGYIVTVATDGLQ